MKRWIKVGGWHVCLDDLKEENWGPRTRQFVYWMVVAAIALVFYIVIYFGGE